MTFISARIGFQLLKLPEYLDQEDQELLLTYIFSESLSLLAITCFSLVLKKAPNSVDQVKYEFKLQPVTANKELNLNLNILDINRQKKIIFLRK